MDDTIGGLICLIVVLGFVVFAQLFPFIKEKVKNNKNKKGNK